MTNNSLPQPKEYLLALKPYEQGKSKVEGGDNMRVIKLSSNENSLGPSPKALEVYKNISTLHRYPDGSMQALRETIAKANKNKANNNIDAERIVCGAGSDELINLLIQAYAGMNDEVLYCEHGFLMYKLYAQSHGATPVAAPEKNLATDVDALLAAVTTRTKIVFVANPNNPTGTYIPFSEVERLRVALPSHIVLVLDAAYAEYADAEDYEAGISLVERTQNTVMLRTFSKAYGLPALRLGWCYAPANIVETLQRIRSPFNVNSPAMMAGVAAVEDIEHLERSITLNREQRKLLTDTFRQLGWEVTPSQANFLLVHFPQTAGKTADDAFKFLMQRGIIVRAVASYGLPHCLRFTIGTEEENRLVIEAMQTFAGLK